MSTKQRAKRPAITGLLLTLALFFCLWVDPKRNGVRQRQLMVVDMRLPESRLMKVPNILHFVWMGGNEPPLFATEVMRFATQRAIAQGFQVKLWRDAHVEALIQNQYPWLLKAWRKLKSDDRRGLATRLADVARLVVVHAEGGIYFDADMVPCRDLHLLVGPAGVATFPWPDLNNPQGPQIKNAIFSAPPGHEVLHVALSRIAKKKDIGDKKVRIKDATLGVGPRLLAAAVLQVLGGAVGRGSSDGMWMELPHTGILLGAPGMVYKIKWVHLAYGSWIGKHIPSRCELKENLHLIAPFLEEACEAERPIMTKWSECGRTPNDAPLEKVRSVGRFDG